jgi:hypothetical protein
MIGQKLAWLNEIVITLYDASLAYERQSPGVAVTPVWRDRGSHSCVIRNGSRHQVSLAGRGHDSTLILICWHAIAKLAATYRNRSLRCCQTIRAVHR